MSYTPLKWKESRIIGNLKRYQSGAYRVEERRVGEEIIWEVFWGAVDHNIPKPLLDAYLDDVDMAMAFCNGHNMRHQQFLENPHYCARCASKITENPAPQKGGGAL